MVVPFGRISESSAPRQQMREERANRSSWLPNYDAVGMAAIALLYSSGQNSSQDPKYMQKRLRNVR